MKKAKGDALSHCLYDEYNHTMETRKCTQSHTARATVLSFCVSFVRSFVCFFILVDKLKHMYTYSYQLEIIEIFCAQHTLYSNAIQWWISNKYTSQRSNINWTVFVFCLKRKLSRHPYSAILQIFAFVQFLKTIAMHRQSWPGKADFRIMVFLNSGTCVIIWFCHGVPTDLAFDAQKGHES